MEQTKTVEGNKLIAEFMGINTIDNICELCGKDVTKEWFCKGNKLKITRSHALGGTLVTLNYNSSWDALMPVVEKITHIEYEKVLQTNHEGVVEISVDTAYPRTFGMLSEEGKPMFRFNRCSIFISDTLIEAAWLAVVDFIQSIDKSLIK